MDKKKIEITVQGEGKSGLSTVEYLIYQHLKKLGFGVNVVLTDDHRDLEDFDSRGKKDLYKRVEAIIEKTDIVIKEHQIYPERWATLQEQRNQKIKVDESSSLGSNIRRLKMERGDRAWYKRWYMNFKVFKYFLRLTVRYILTGNRKWIDASDDVAELIKDDIEFGYDLNMIYVNILNGNYNNTPIPEKYDWFKKHDMNWDVMLDPSGIRTLLDLKGKIDFDFKTIHEVKAYVNIQIENKRRESELRSK